MEHRDYQRRTCDALFFPPFMQFWADTVADDLMWDLAYLHHALKRKDYVEFKKLAPWSNHFKSLAGEIAGSEVHFNDQSCQALSMHRVANTTPIIAYL